MHPVCDGQISLTTNTGGATIVVNGAQRVKAIRREFSPQMHVTGKHSVSVAGQVGPWPLLLQGIVHVCSVLGRA